MSSSTTLPRSPATSSHHPLRTWLASLSTGAIATAADALVLTILVGAWSWSPHLANLPALMAGATIQFVGHRHVVFGSSNNTGPGTLRRQLLGFALVETVALLLHAGLFHLVMSHMAPLMLTPLLLTAGSLAARLIIGMLVFGLWSFPLWSRVFSEPEASEEPALSEP